MKRTVIIASLAVTLAFVALAASAYTYTTERALTPLGKVISAIKGV